MTTGGWIIMTLSVGFVTILMGWSVYKVIFTPGSSDHVHSPADIDPHDQED